MVSEEHYHMFTSWKFQDNEIHWQQFITNGGKSMNKWYPQQHSEHKKDAVITGMAGSKHYIWKVDWRLVLGVGLVLTKDMAMGPVWEVWRNTLKD